MQITLDIPEMIAKQLRHESGATVEQTVLEALAVELYRRGSISIGLLAQMLKMGVIQADRWLADRGIPSNYDEREYEADLQTMGDLFPGVKG